jgi:SAM-dependent methyltransferase
MTIGEIHEWTVLENMPNNFFKNKKLLELGCGYADLGNEFFKLGACVTSCDVRNEHIEVVKIKYPHLNARIFDAETDNIPTKYDIILHWGLLYHLNDIERHLSDVCKNCDFLLLETEVSDSDDDQFVIKLPEAGFDQAFHEVGTRPSPGYVEKLLKNNGFNYTVIKDKILNSDFHVYDWDIKNSNNWEGGLRRFWICWKNNIQNPITSL